MIALVGARFLAAAMIVGGTAMRPDPGSHFDRMIAALLVILAGVLFVYPPNALV